MLTDDSSAMRSANNSCTHLTSRSPMTGTILFRSEEEEEDVLLNEPSLSNSKIFACSQENVKQELFCSVKEKAF